MCQDLDQIQCHLRLVALLLLHLSNSDHDCAVRGERIVQELGHSMTNMYPSSLKQIGQYCSVTSGGDLAVDLVSVLRQLQQT